MELVTEIKATNDQVMKLNSLINDYVTKLEEAYKTIEEQKEVIDSKDEEIEEVKEQLQTVAKDNEKVIAKNVAKEIASVGFKKEELPNVIENAGMDLMAQFKSIKGKKAAREFYLKHKEALLKAQLD